jgi:hypothetical protein
MNSHLERKNHNKVMDIKALFGMHTVLYRWNRKWRIRSTHRKDIGLMEQPPARAT